VIEKIAEYSSSAENIKKLRKGFFTDTNFYRLRTEDHQKTVLHACMTGERLKDNKITRGKFIL
jgi:hypothetical protein